MAPGFQTLMAGDMGQSLASTSPTQDADKSLQVADALSAARLWPSRSTTAAPIDVRRFERCAAIPGWRAHCQGLASGQPPSLTPVRWPRSISTPSLSPTPGSSRPMHLRPTKESLVGEWETAFEYPSLKAFLAEDHGEPVGTVAVRADPDFVGFGQLRRLYVLPDRWGRGAGSALARRLAALEDDGVSRIRPVGAGGERSGPALLLNAGGGAWCRTRSSNGQGWKSSKSAIALS